MPFKQLDSNLDAKQNLLIIPTGVACGKGKYTEEENLDVFTKKKDLKTPETNLSVFIPEDGNIYHDGFATILGYALTHSPQQKAAMLYEGICAKKEDSENAPFKFDNIYLTGGFDTGEVIKELEKIIQEKGPLPKRKDNLRVFGFSDASQLHHYLGQRGIASEMYYSADEHCLAWDLAEEKQIEPIQLTAVNDKAKEVETLTGYTQPGSQVSVEKSKTHQTALFDDNNMLVVEFRRADREGTEEIKRFVETISQFDKPLTLVLSKDSTEEAMKVLNGLLQSNEKLKDVPMFFGAPVGHGECRKWANARAIPLFAKSIIKKGKDGTYQMDIQERASDRVKELPLSQRRVYAEKLVETKEPITRDVFVEGEAGSAGMVISNLEHIEKNATEYHVHLPQNHDPIQMIRGTIGYLMNKGILSKEEIKTLVFDSNRDLSKKELANAQRYITDFLKRTFDHPPKIGYTADPNTSSKMLNTNEQTKLAGLYGLLNEAEQQGDFEKVNQLLTQVPKPQEQTLWVLQTKMKLALAQCDWKTALSILEQTKKQLPKDRYKSHKAALLLKLGQVKEAYNTMPAHLAVALAYAKVMPSKAIKILKKSWDIQPAWPIYIAYKKAIQSLSAKKRLKAILDLTRKTRDQRYSLLARADMDMDLHNWARAKENLEIYLQSYPLTRQVALMMANIERTAWHHEEAASEWERKSVEAEDPALWTCMECNHSVEDWQILCPHCNSFDSLYNK